MSFTHIIKMIVLSDLNTKNFIKAEQLLRKVLILNNTDEYNLLKNYSSSTFF